MYRNVGNSRVKILQKGDWVNQYLSESVANFVNIQDNNKDVVWGNHRIRKDSSITSSNVIFFYVSISKHLEGVYIK